MNAHWLCMLVFCSLAFSGGAAGPSSSRQPAYPVFGILETDPPLQGKEVKLEGRENFDILSQLQLVYTSDTPALQMVRDAKKQFGYPLPVIVYMGGFTTNAGGATLIEQKYRSAVGMIDVTKLAQAIDATATEFAVGIPDDGELPIVASTADVSDPKDFNSWPGGPDYLRYGLDPATEAAQRFKADMIVNLMKTGYDGAWLDTFQVGLYNHCDGVGRKIQFFWDFKAGRRYDHESRIAALQEMVRSIRKMVKDAVGRDPFLAANSVSGTYDTGGKEMFAAPDRPGLLDAYDFEDSYIAPRATRAQGRKLNAAFVPVATVRWTKNMINQSDAAKSGLRALCMIGPAGYVAAYINPSLTNYDQLVRFGWCSFLLTVTKERTTWFGMPLLVTNLKDGVGFLPLPEMVFSPIGDPVEDVDLKPLQEGDSGCYMRRFTNGLVVVNSGAKKGKQTVGIPAGYVDRMTKKPVKEVTLDGGDAGLLLKAGK
ncbi:MAG: hypothetical protein NTW86_18760 [Candidatus Sumerlaeota bacterium]|nr:hypothetical protein [Candidatus Sumerlaeota bacterium]